MIQVVQFKIIRMLINDFFVQCHLIINKQLIINIIKPHPHRFFECTSPLINNMQYCVCVCVCVCVCLYYRWQQNPTCLRSHISPLVYMTITISMRLHTFDSKDIPFHLLHIMSFYILWLQIMKKQLQPDMCCKRPKSGHLTSYS